MHLCVMMMLHEVFKLRLCSVFNSDCHYFNGFFVGVVA